MKRFPKPLPQRRRIRRHDLEEHRRPLGPGEPAAALADRAAGAGAGHRRPDHGRVAEDAEVFLGVHDAQVDRHHGTGAGAGAHRLAAVRGHAEAGGGHADLAAADRVDNPLPAVRAAAGDAAVGLAVRLGQRPAPVPLVRTGGHAEAVGAERRPGRAVARKSVVEGKRVSVRVDLGGRRHNKKKTTDYDKEVLDNTYNSNTYATIIRLIDNNYNTIINRTIKR